VCSGSGALWANSDGREEEEAAGAAAAVQSERTVRPRPSAGWQVAPMCAVR